MQPHQRAQCLWGAENNFLANIKRAKEEAASQFLVFSGLCAETSLRCR